MFVLGMGGYSLDWIKITKWIWPKTVNMTKKLTRTNINIVNLTKIIINTTTMMNPSVWIWPKVKILKNILNIATTTNITMSNWYITLVYFLIVIRYLCIKCDHYFKQVFWFSFDFRGTFSEYNRHTSLNLSETPMAQASTRPPCCTTPRELTKLYEFRFV